MTPRVATQPPIQTVKRRWQAGDLARLTLREDNRKKIMLMLNSEEPTDLWPEVDPDIWDPDISRSYQERSTLLIKSVLAERADNGRWQPLDRDMVDWLADWPTNEQIVIGVYVEPATTASGQMGWRFSVQPGQNYVLLARQLPPADAEELAVAVQDSQTGLLVAFALNRNPDCPGIRLARSVSIPTELTAYRRYPDLQLPFDRRNLDWAALFTDNLEHIAERVEKSSQWILLLGDPPIPGFPRSLEVKWGDERPPFNRTHAELSNIQWYLRDGVVVADWGAGV